MRGGALWAAALASLAGAADFMDMFAPKGIENIDPKTIEAPPSTEKVFQLLLHHLTMRDRSPILDPITKYGVFDGLTSPDCSCVCRLERLMERTQRTQFRLEASHANFTDFAGLFTLLYEYPEENAYLWVIAGHLRHIFDLVNGHFADGTLWMLDRKECMPPPVRNTLLDMLTRWKKLQTDGISLLWNGAGFGVMGDVHTTSFVKTSAQRNEDMTFVYMWSDAISKVFEMHTEALAQTLMGLNLQETTNARLYADEEYGMFEKTEIWRRDVFNQWALDKGLLRGILQHVVKTDGIRDPLVTLGDFGAGSGHYAKWLNDTGLMQAWAYDGARGVEEVTKGAVTWVNLCEHLDTQRRFDWVMSLEVAEHIPPQFSRQFLENIARHSRDVLAISWSDDDEGIGHINVRTQEAFIREVNEVTGFVKDDALTKLLHESSSIDYISRSIVAFRRPPHLKSEL
jgi:2-polyprenyl-3-methyl-5-hydroxy-6-metoxy-1,4-benzoquinol methylase